MIAVTLHNTIPFTPQVCYLSVILLMSLEWTSAQAPGDESANCLNANSEDYIAPLDTERFLMQSRYYNNLFGSGGVWTALDEDGDRRTVSVITFITIFTV